MQNLVEWLDYWAQRFPDKPAVIFEQQSISYQQFAARSYVLAQQFVAAGWSGKRVAILLPNGAELAVLFFAALRAGVTLVPRRVIFRAAQLENFIKNTTPAFAIVDATVVAEISPDAICGRDACYLVGENIPVHYQSFAQFQRETPHTVLVPPLDPDAPAAIFPTSGSTGNPKFTLHSQKTLLAMADSLADCMDFTPDDRLLVSDYMVTVSRFMHLCTALAKGGTAVIMEHFSIHELKTVLNQHRPTLMCMLGLTNIDIINSPELSRADFASMRLNLSGGDKITRELTQVFTAKTGAILRQGYGLSECLLLTVNRSDDPNKFGALGLPCKDVTIELRNENGDKVASPNIGEVWAKGPNIMVGYWQNPVETAKTIVDGWLRTGDLAYTDADGYLWFVGRVKRIIKRQGATISPYEIEEALCDHPAIHAAAVVGIPDPQEGEAIYAFVELKSPITVAELEVYLKTQLSELYQPRAIQILTALPRTISDKIDYEQLKELIKKINT